MIVGIDPRLHVTIMERTGTVVGGQQDALIGSTRIDLEDRFFHARYPKMVNEGVTPVEARRLFAENSSFGRGHVRLWVDVMLPQYGKKDRIMKS